MRIILVVLLLAGIGDLLAGLKQKYDIDDPVERYCLFVEVIARTILSGRDKGVRKEKVVRDMLKIEEIKREEQLQRDVVEIANFVYDRVPNESAGRLVMFIADKWCMTQLKK